MLLKYGGIIDDVIYNFVKYRDFFIYNNNTFFLSIGLFLCILIRNVYLFTAVSSVYKANE